MLRFFLALAVLIAAPVEAAFATAAPSHFGTALSREITSDGPRAVAWRLTLKHNWSRVIGDIATNNPALSSATVRALLDYAPKHEKAAIQQALRTRLEQDTRAGLAALSPVVRSPYSGHVICGAGEARWKHHVQPALLATHDIVYALQREDCLKALRLHS